MPELTPEQALEQSQEALRGLLEAQRELGWQLAREKLEEGKVGFLLDDIGEQETRQSLAEGHGITFPNAKEAIDWLKSGSKEI